MSKANPKPTPEKGGSRTKNPDTTRLTPYVKPKRKIIKKKV